MIDIPDRANLAIGNKYQTNPGLSCNAKRCNPEKPLPSSETCKSGVRGRPCVHALVRPIRCPARPLAGRVRCGDVICLGHVLSELARGCRRRPHDHKRPDRRLCSNPGALKLMGVRGKSKGSRGPGVKGSRSTEWCRVLIIAHARSKKS
jgi:hypothetical protein